MSAIFHEVNFALGEGADEIDLIAMQRKHNALILDGLVRESLREFEEQRPTAPSSGEDTPIALNGFACAFVTTASARTFTNLAGMLLRHDLDSTEPPTGAAPRTFPYYVSGGELVTTCAVGDATNPRIDSLFGQITEVLDGSATRHFMDSAGAKTTQATNKTRTWTMATQLVAGTPASTPVAPAHPTGRWMRLCSVYVPATHNAVIDPDNLWDERRPMRYRPVLQMAAGALNLNAADFQLVPDGMAQAGNAGDAILFSPAHGGAALTARVLRVRMLCALSTGAVVTLCRLNADPVVRTLTTLRTITPTLPFNGEHVYDFVSGSGYSTGPMWTNSVPGTRANASGPGTAADLAALVLRVVAGATGDAVSHVKWELLE